MNIKDALTELAAVSVIEDMVKARRESLREFVGEKMCEMHELAGVKQLENVLPNGVVVATTTLAGGGVAPSVADAIAFAQYVEEIDPTAVERIVRPDVSKRILADLKATDDGRAIDENGEVVPGVRFYPKRTYPTTRFKTGGKEAVVSAFRSGAYVLDLTDRPALTGDTDADDE